MTRLIDVDVLKAMLAEDEITFPMLDDVHTVDAVPVRHGRWIFIRDEGGGNSLYSCSECGRGDIHCPEVIVPYCWHCGAKMDAERKDNETD